MLIDLSHTVEDGMITYKGLPAPVVCDYLSREASRKVYAPGTEFQIGKIEMVANTGTYLDSPFHRYADGKDLSELPLDRLANLEAVVVRWDFGRGVRSASRSSTVGRAGQGSPRPHRLVGSLEDRPLLRGSSLPDPRRRRASPGGGGDTRRASTPTTSTTQTT